MQAVGSFVIRVALIVIFFVLITPLAVILKVLGFDPLKLRKPRNTSSYWIVRAKQKPKTVEFNKLT